MREMVTQPLTIGRKYQGYVRAKWAVIFATLLITIFLMLYAIVAGSANLSIAEVVRTLLGEGDARMNVIIWNIRLPRVLAAVVAGMGLSVAGAVAQSVLRNPLASPFTLGITQGAAFGAAVAIFFLGAGGARNMEHVFINNPYVVVIFAFAGSLTTTLVVIFLAKMFRATPEALVLSGVALSSLFQSGTMLIQYFADDVTVASIVFWTFGDIGRATWKDLGIMTVIVLVATLYFVYNRWNYNALDSGEEAAKGLGVDVERVRLVGMFVTALVAAVIVAFLGIIGFIGLIGPHIMRRLIGGDHRYLIPASTVFGGFILLASDTVGRVILSPIILPVGIVTSALGAPVFLYVLARGYRR